MESKIILTDKWLIPFIIDEEDYDKVAFTLLDTGKAHRWWHISHWGYPSTNIPDVGCVTIQIFLLGKAPIGTKWDHFNRNKLDNRKENIRAVSHSISQINRGLSCHNTTGEVGIYRIMPNERSKVLTIKWGARIEYERKQIHIGTYDTFEEAVEARHSFAKKLGFYVE
jgi:hypothetical protein